MVVSVFAGLGAASLLVELRCDRTKSTTFCNLVDKDIFLYFLKLLFFKNCDNFDCLFFSRMASDVVRVVVAEMMAQEEGRIEK